MSAEKCRARAKRCARSAAPAAGWRAAGRARTATARGDWRCRRRTETPGRRPGGSNPSMGLRRASARNSAADRSWDRGSGARSMPPPGAAASIWHHYPDPSFDLPRYYELTLGAVPYWGYYLLVYVLAFPFGVDIANRLVLSLYVLGLPLATLLLARRFGRSAWLALCTFPLTWSYCFAMGFVTYCI